jgi:hypothetical protein
MMNIELHPEPAIVAKWHDKPNRYKNKNQDKYCLSIATHDGRIRQKWGLAEKERVQQQGIGRKPVLTGPTRHIITHSFEHGIFTSLKS